MGLSNDLKEQSVIISRCIAQRVVHLPFIENAVMKSANLSPSRGQAPWNPASLADGIPGIWLLFAEWDQLEPENGWKERIHHHVLSLFENMALRTSDLTLFSGVTGLSYGLLIASDQRSNYSQARANLNYVIASHFTNHTLEASGLDALEIINGLSGAGRYILESYQDEGICEIAEPFFAMLVKEAHSFMDGIRSSAPDTIRLGMAHGLAGTLALLVTALHKGFEVEGLHIAIDRMADYLAQQIRRDRFGLYWPVSPGRNQQWSKEEREETREIEGWCHGTLGISVTLMRAGIICGREPWKALADEAARSVFRVGDDELNAMTPSFCHGLAGLLHLSNFVYNLSGNEEAALFSDRVAGKLIRMFDESLPFGYQDLEDAVSIDNPGLLQGAVGIALSLLDYGRWDDPKYLGKWKEVFLVS
ncbi:lanthionine synthetase C family protein [Paenibacillus sp. VCA1]|uniref:lanthionine synthetase C family protein n=1 Tax=Paenibacillus sp. VCA1 TaxID=3039148 RepID=UPI0028719DF2|nr:lanthionine synthetase C family protein [Paenibacillus sp. VCA1]MDR9857743.1 lanthionine synthetase C family protein [Paenibacillus sp. VCA1]